MSAAAAAILKQTIFVTPFLSLVGFHWTRRTRLISALRGRRHAIRPSLNPLCDVWREREHRAAIRLGALIKTDVRSAFGFVFYPLRDLR